MESTIFYGYPYASARIQTGTNCSENKSTPNEVLVDPEIGKRARLPIDRMLAFTEALKSGRSTTALIPRIGAA